MFSESASLLVALLPTHSEFDTEALAAERHLPVLRFTFLETVVLERPPLALQCRAVHRGFMLSAERYRIFHDALAEIGIHLVVTPKEYERAHYYPNVYPALRNISPNAVWVAVESPQTVCAERFKDAVQIIEGWPDCRFVLLKDFVKSPKDSTQRFMKAEVGPELTELACELVAVRGVRFNRGVVFKEWMPLVNYMARRGPVTNEWRLFFMCGKLVSMDPNSFQDGTCCSQPPDEIIAAVCEAVMQIGSPYMTVDLAEGEDRWFALEAGDGGVSGPAPWQDIELHWASLVKYFEAADGAATEGFDVCRVCDGSGKLLDDGCPLCDGLGCI